VGEYFVRACANTSADVFVQLVMVWHDRFPQYYWSVVVCQYCSNTKHLGWKFTHKMDPSKHFYALIVATAEEREFERESTQGVLGVATNIILGVDAPSWVTALAGIYVNQITK
jgi:hypothetical protein